MALREEDLLSLRNFGRKSLDEIKEKLVQRGFLTPDILADANAPGTTPVALNACTAATCPQAPSFCMARGYQPGTDSYERCVVSVSQNLRSARR